MSRNENEDLSHLNTFGNNSTEITYCFDGGKTISKNECEKISQTVCAKIIKSIVNDSDAIQNSSNNTSYYILCNNHNMMFDPREKNPRYKRNLWKYRKVDYTTFNLYMKFLKEKYTSLLTQAERRL